MKNARKTLVAKHFQYYERLVDYVNKYGITDIVSITDAGKYSEGHVLFFWE